MKEELRAQTFVTDDDRRRTDSMKTIYLPLKGVGGGGGHKYAS